MATFTGKSAEDAGYHPLPDGVRYQRTSVTMGDWGGYPPPLRVKRTLFAFWDGTEIPGGVAEAALPAVRALDKIFERYNYRLDDEADDWCWNRRKIRGSKKAWSSHSWAAALDINAKRNPWSYRFKSDMPPNMIREIEELKTETGKPVWRWGGRFRYKTSEGKYRGKADAMHFEIACSPADIASGIAGTKPTQPKEEPMALQPHEQALLDHGFSSQATIRAWFQELLGRPPGPAGLEYWTGLLDSGQYTKAQVFTAIANSKEAKAYAKRKESEAGQ